MAKVKVLRTNRQTDNLTDQKLYAPDLSLRLGHENVLSLVLQFFYVYKHLKVMQPLICLNIRFGQLEVSFKFTQSLRKKTEKVPGDAS